MAYLVRIDRNQASMATMSLDDLIDIDKDNPVRAIDAYVNSLDLKVGL